MITCIVVDDEPLALDIVADDISKVDFLKLVKTCTSAHEAIEILHKEKIDLMFLDIQMPGINGLQLLKGLEHPPVVIFNTAYEKYAIDGFNLDVIDYLLKPVPFNRFLKSCDKAKEIIEFKKYSGKTGKNNFFFIKSEYRTVKIFYNEVLYIEGLKDYVKIFCTNREHAVLCRMNLKNISELLNGNSFFRIHRSYIVNLSKISSTNKSFIEIEGKKIPVGNNYREAFIDIHGL